jgi:hypothetical protein
MAAERSSHPPAHGPTKRPFGTAADERRTTGFSFWT